MTTLSVIVITYNEAHHITACLQSVAFADEVIVVDSSSTDDTVSLAQQCGARVLVADWPGYGLQKNRALALATSDWVLSIDADERVSPLLAAEIQTFLAKLNTNTRTTNTSNMSTSNTTNTTSTINPTNTASHFAIPFISFFLGQRIRFGDWSQEKHVRLFKRVGANFDNAGLHENLVIQGTRGFLQHHIYHEPYQDWAEVHEKIDRYARIGKTLLRQKGKRLGLVPAVLHGWWAFCRSYLCRAGFLDGRPGLNLAISIAQYTYRRYR